MRWCCRPRRAGVDAFGIFVRGCCLWFVGGLRHFKAWGIFSGAFSRWIERLSFFYMDWSIGSRRSCYVSLLHHQHASFSSRINKKRGAITNTVASLGLVTGVNLPAVVVGEMIACKSMGNSGDDCFFPHKLSNRGPNELARTSLTTTCIHIALAGILPFIFSMWSCFL